MYFGMSAENFTILRGIQFVQDIKVLWIYFLRDIYILL